jgi:hypothetical protein
VGWNFLTNEYRGGDVAFDRTRYLSARVASPRLHATYRELERRLAEEPGVSGVTAASALPGMKHGEFFLEFRDLDPIRPADGPLWVQTSCVDASFFDTFGARFAVGRSFTTADVALERNVAVVDRAFVQHVLGGRNPVGHLVRQPQNSENQVASPW